MNKSNKIGPAVPVDKSKEVIEKEQRELAEKFFNNENLAFEITEEEVYNEDE